MSENSQHKNYWAVVPAAGVGQRMASDTPKQYLSLLNKPIIEHTLERLLSHPKITGVVVALGDHDAYWADVNLDTGKPVIRVNGGQERCHSVLNALKKLKDMTKESSVPVEDADWVLVHDAARPCLRLEDIDKLITGCELHSSGGILALPVRDTMKRQRSDQSIAETVDRTGLWHALTPQMFILNELHDAIDDAINAEQLITDEASAMELKGLHPLLVEGHEDNIKITRPADLKLAEMYLRAQGEELADE